MQRSFLHAMGSVTIKTTRPASSPPVYLVPFSPESDSPENSARQLADQVPAALLAVDDLGEIVWGNAAATSLFVDGLSWSQVLPDVIERQRLQDFLQHQDQPHIKLRGSHKCWLRAVKVPQTGHDRLILLTEISSEVAGMDAAAERISELERLLRLSQQDRQLIAFEIHDGLVQEMTAAQMFLEAGLSSITPDAPPTRHALETLHDSVTWLQKAIEDARRLVQGLEPPELAERGLSQAVADLIASQLLGDIDVSLDASDRLDNLDTTLALSLFRMIQESLTNIWKHAEATHAWVKMSHEGNEIHISIRDNGKGFDPEQGVAQRFGLKGMRQRAVTFGGTLQIQSEPNLGSTVSIVMPVIAASDRL